MSEVKDTESASLIESFEAVEPDAVLDELRSLRALSASWLEARVDEFDPFDWDTIQERELRRKAFGEAGLCLLQARELDPDFELPAIRDWVAEVTNDERYFHLLKRKPSMVRLYGYPIVFEHRNGNLAAEAPARDLRKLLKSDTVWGQERVPFEYLDIWHMAKFHGVESRFGPEEILQFSHLNNGFDAFGTATNDINAFTHDIMFYHALGMNPDDIDLPDGPAPYDNELSLKLLAFRLLGEQNLDSGIEVLMCGVLQRQLPPDLVRAWLGYASEMASGFGFVPKELGDDEGKIDRATNEDPLAEKLDYLPDEELEWLVHYHVNLVTILATNAMIDDWEEYVEETETAGLDDGAYDMAGVRKLAEAVKSLADYDLKKGAKQLEGLRDNPVVEAYPDVYEATIEFLDGQRRDDSQFGFWTDEKTKFLSMGYDPETFERKMVSPTSEVCETALQKIE